jgi:hypothetical protein
MTIRKQAQVAMAQAAAIRDYVTMDNLKIQVQVQV